MADHPGKHQQTHLKTSTKLATLFVQNSILLIMAAVLSRMPSIMAKEWYFATKKRLHNDREDCVRYDYKGPEGMG